MLKDDDDDFVFCFPTPNFNEVIVGIGKFVKWKLVRFGDLKISKQLLGQF